MALYFAVRSAISQSETDRLLRLIDKGTASGIECRQSRCAGVSIDATLSPVVVAGQRLSPSFSGMYRSAAGLKPKSSACAQRKAISKRRCIQNIHFRSYGAERPVLSLIQQVATGDTTVLISGETGTGNELSELFGHEKGAFTGATTQRKGRFELAHGGALFLDEVGELSMAAQAKLLRVMQEREFERVGGTQTVKVDVRLIAASNRDLMAMVKEAMALGSRDDCFRRLLLIAVCTGNCSAALHYAALDNAS